MERTERIEMIRAALIQMTSEYDSQASVEKASTLIESAAKDGTSIVCLQELFHTVYFPWEMSAEHFALAEPLNGPIVRRMRELARQYQIVLIAPIFEKEVDGLYFNSAPVIGPDGDLIGCYRKSHIPIVHGDLITASKRTTSATTNDLRRRSDRAEQIKKFNRADRHG